MTDITWIQLKRQLDDLAQSGRREEGYWSELSGGESIVKYPKQSVCILREWIAQAHGLCIQNKLWGVERAVAEALEESLGSHSEVDIYTVSSLRFSDFYEYEQIAHVTRKQGAGKSTGRAPGSFEVSDYEDHVEIADAHYRFHVLLESCRSIANRLSESRIESDGTDQRFMSVQELALLRDVEPETIRKEVSEYRRKNNKRDPIWVWRFPGKKRGFKVLRAIYLAEQRAGVVR